MIIGNKKCWWRPQFRLRTLILGLLLIGPVIAWRAKVTYMSWKVGKEQDLSSELHRMSQRLHAACCDEASKLTSNNKKLTSRGGISASQSIGDDADSEDKYTIYTIVCARDNDGDAGEEVAFIELRLRRVGLSIAPVKISGKSGKENDALIDGVSLYCKNKGWDYEVDRTELPRR
jgi:hypothetical protein